MRYPTTVSLAGLALVGLGAGLLMAPPSTAASPTFYFHSASGLYAQDFAGGVPGAGVNNNTPPPGATTTTTKPTGTKVAEAKILAGLSQTSLVAPTFPMPFTGSITSACFDGWYSARGTAPASPAPIKLSFQVVNPDGIGRAYDTTVGSADGSMQRVTKKIDGAAFEVKAGAKIQFYTSPTGLPVDTTLYYGSATTPTSVTFNSADCPATGGGAPEPTATSGSPSPSPSPTTTSPAPTPSGTPSVTPSLSPSASPSPTVAPAVETTVSYTGATAGRYSTELPVSAKVQTYDGAAVPSGLVRFTLGDESVEAEVGSDGTASGVLPLTTESGSQVLTVTFDRTSAFAGSRREAIVRVDPMPVSCRIARRVASNRSHLTVTYVTAAGEAPAPLRVSFYYDTRGFATVTTDDSGIGRTTAGAGARGHSFTAKSAATPYYTACSTTVRI